VKTIENRLPDILQSWNKNANFIQSLASTIFEFMKQFQFVGANVGSLGLEGHASTLGQNIAHVVRNNTMLERKGKILVA
jgi:hypothetical protein